MPTKNDTRLSSLMGTWTWYSKLKVLSYNIKASWVLYVAPDPLRQYQCQLDGCLEANNQFCQLDKDNNYYPKCFHMTDTIATYGDAIMYFRLSFEIDGNFPIREHGILGTGSWVGPYTIFWAQDPTNLHRYVIRYVETAMSGILTRRLDNDTLYPLDIFYQPALGVPAVISMIRRQSQLEFGQDPYEGQKKTCDKGQVQPLLPLFAFEFKGDNNNNNDTATIDWQFDYKLLVAPGNPSSPFARVLPVLAREVQSIPSLGVTLEGPYCWQDDPKRVWMLGTSLNSTNLHDTTISFAKGCVQGFPCRPEQIIYEDAASGHHPIVPDCPTVVNNVLFWKLATTVLLLLWTCTVIPLCCGCCGRGRNVESFSSSSIPRREEPDDNDEQQQQQQEDDQVLQPQSSANNDSSNSERDEEAAVDLEEPLLPRDAHTTTDTEGQEP